MPTANRGSLDYGHDRRQVGPPSLLGAEEAASGAAREEAPGQELSHRFMDLETCGAADPPAVRDTLPSLSCLEAPDPVGMELSEPRTLRAAAERGRDRPMETVPLAAYKKTPDHGAPIWSSSMNPVFCSSPMWPAPGRRKAARRSCAICTNRIGSPRSAPWLCRPRASAWRSISGCAAVLSWGWMSEPSCVTCFGICGVLWSCCRIEEPFITEKLSHNGSSPIQGSTWKRLGLRARPEPGRICVGHRPIGPWPTLPLWT